MIKKIRLFLTIVITLFMISGVLTAFDVVGNGPDLRLREKISVLAVVFIFGVVLFLIIYYWYGNEHKCTSCKKRFCLKKVREEIISKENISVLVETKERDNKGEVTKTSEQYVPGEKITYKTLYVCKKCGNKCSKTHIKKVPLI